MPNIYTKVVIYPLEKMQEKRRNIEAKITGPGGLNWEEYIIHDFFNNPKTKIECKITHMGGVEWKKSS